MPMACKSRMARPTPSPPSRVSAVTDTTNTGGAGQIVTNSTEGSNVDIATEFTKLIVAQQAYSANTKVVTTADQMLQQTINMKT